MPLFLKVTSAPPASRLMSPAESSVMFPELKARVVPSIVKLSMARAEIMVLPRLFEFDVLIKAAEVVTPAAVTLPPTARVLAISTAPSMSTTSRLVVPSTSMSPEMSRDANTEVPVAVTVPVTSMPVEVVAIFSELL